MRASDGQVRAGWRSGCLLHRGLADGLVPRKGRDQGRGEELSGRSGGKVDPNGSTVEIDPLLALLISQGQGQG